MDPDSLAPQVHQVLQQMTELVARIHNGLWRGYSEQVAVACLLQGGGWRLRFASHYLLTRRPEALGAGIIGSLPLVDGALESSLWLEKTAGAQPP